MHGVQPWATPCYVLLSPFNSIGLGAGARERDAQLAREGAFAAKALSVPEPVEPKVELVQPKAKSLVRMGMQRKTR